MARERGDLAGVLREASGRRGVGWGGWAMILLGLNSTDMLRAKSR